MYKDNKKCWEMWAFSLKNAFRDWTITQRQFYHVKIFTKIHRLAKILQIMNSWKMIWYIFCQIFQYMPIGKKEIYWPRYRRLAYVKLFKT